MVVTASLKQAFRERPSGLYGHVSGPGYSSSDSIVSNAMRMLNGMSYFNGSRQVPSIRERISNERAMRHNANPKNRVTARLNNEVPTAVLCKDYWTAEEFRTFRHLVDRCMDPDAKKRADGEVWMRRFREKHGDDVCRMMLDEIRRLDQVEWFKRKNVTRGA